MKLRIAFQEAVILREAKAQISGRDTVLLPPAGHSMTLLLATGHLPQATDHFLSKVTNKLIGYEKNE